MAFRNQLAPKIWLLPLTLQPSRQYHVYRRRALAQSLPGGVCLLLKAIGASEGWRNAIRYHTRSLSQPATRIPPWAGFSLPPKALLHIEVTCPSPKTANWPRAVDGPEVTPCVILLEKTRILCNFIKLSPRSWPLHPVICQPRLPRRFGDRAAARPQCRSYAPKIPILCNFMRKFRRPVSKPGTSRNGEKLQGPALEAAEKILEGRGSFPRRLTPSCLQ